MASANPASVDVKDELVSAGIGVFAGTGSGTWGIYISREPISPDTTITLFDVGGAAPNPKWLLDFSDVQVRVRGAKLGYQAAYDKMRDCMDALVGLAPKTINGTAYKAIWQQTDIFFLKYDESNRPIMVCTFRCVREPDSGTNRQSF